MTQAGLPGICELLGISSNLVKDLHYLNPARSDAHLISALSLSFALLSGSFQSACGGQQN